jgi:hypothetical protein
MTEAAQEQAQVEQQQEPHSEYRPNSYEWIRDTGAGGIITEAMQRKWVQADTRASRLRDQYRHIEEDQDLTPEAKDKRLQDLYERNRHEIENLKHEATRSLLSEARMAERRSRPWPTGENREPTDPQRLLLAAQEGDRLVRIAQRRATITTGGRERPNPLFSITSFLREQYGSGLQEGGPAGAARCAGTLRACEELGVSEDEVLNVHRDEHQIELIDNARRMADYSRLVDMTVPKPPKHNTGPKKLRSERRNQNRLVPGNTEQMPKKSAKHW